MLQQGTRFLITGAASGIGAATTERLVRAGHRVAVCDVEYRGAEALCERLGERAFAVELDVRDETLWLSAIEAVWDRFDGLDVLVNNAGLVHTGYTHELPREKLFHMVDVNLRGVALGTTLVVPRFLQQGHGHVINVASLASFVPMPGMAMYAATKHAVRAFTHGVALELEDTPLAFTVVCPAAVETPMLDAQIHDDAAVLSFADPTVTPQRVAEAIERAAAERPREVLVPRGRGNVLRVAGLFPGLLARMLPGARKRGAAELARRRAAQPPKESS